MAQRIPGNFSTVDRSLVATMGNTMPPRDPNDDDDDEPMISVGHDDDDDEAERPRMVPVRRRAVKTDPPELAARAGEVSLGARPERSVDDQPAGHSPDSGVRTRIRRHSSQRSTSSGGAARR